MCPRNSSKNGKSKDSHARAEASPKKDPSCGSSIHSFLNHLLHPTRSMHTVNQGDRLFGRGANPQTGLVTPTEESVESGGSRQHVTRPKIEPVARHPGSWKKSKNAWDFVRTTEELEIVQAGQPDEGRVLKYQHNDERLNLVDPPTPLTPPDSASSTSHEKFQIRRKPVGSGPSQKSSTRGGSPEERPTAYEQRFLLESQLSHRIKDYSIGASKTPSPIQTGTEDRTGKESERQRDETSLYTTANSDILTGWVVETPKSKPTTITFAGQNNNARPHLHAHRHAIPIEKTNTKPILARPVASRKSKRPSISSWLAHFNLSQTKFSEPTYATPSQTTTTARSIPPQAMPQMKKSCHVIIAEISSLLTDYAELKNLFQSPWIKRCPVTVIECVLCMIHHIIRTLFGPDGGYETGILERNSPIDLLLCLGYIVALFLGFRLLIPCITCITHFLRTIASVVQWITYLC